MKVYNLIGQEVATLVNDEIGAGSYNVRWSGRDEIGQLVGSGIYFFKLLATPMDAQSLPFSQVRKMILMK